MKDAYIIYVEKFGKIQSNSLEDNDYGEAGPNGYVEYDERGKLAVSLAAVDVRRNVDLRTKSDFEQELKRLLEK